MRGRKRKEESVNVLIRNVPDELCEKLEKLAHEEKISVNQLVLRLIGKWYKLKREERAEQRRREQVRRRLGRLRKKFRNPYLGRPDEEPSNPWSR